MNGVLRLVSHDAPGRRPRADRSGDYRSHQGAAACDEALLK
jgi:hypothetical protein